MSTSNLTPRHDRAAGQTRNKQKHDESLVTASAGPHARFAKATPVVTARRTPNPSAKRTAKSRTKKASAANGKG